MSNHAELMTSGDWRYDANQPKCSHCGRWIYQVTCRGGQVKWYHQKRATDSCAVAAS